MVKSRQRNAQIQLNKSFIIKSKRSWWQEVIVGLFTLLVWTYCLTVVYFFVDALFSLNHEFPALFKTIFKMTNNDTWDIIKIGIILFISMYILLSAWGHYNKKRYGSLRRRKYPTPTTEEDLMKLNLIDEITYEELQNEKLIVLELNPVGRAKEQNETAA
jgi:poly-beta-1,6-N-acetyl-D-glucosamine synthesis protein